MGTIITTQKPTFEQFINAFNCERVQDLIKRKKLIKMNVFKQLLSRANPQCFDKIENPEFKAKTMTTPKFISFIKRNW